MKITKRQLILQPNLAKKYLSGLYKQGIRTDDVQNLVNQYGVEKVISLTTNRRNFMILSGGLIAAAMSGCSTGPDIFEPQAPIVYPKLPGKKIQDPYHYGHGHKVMTGIYGGEAYFDASGEIEKYEQMIGKPLTVWTLSYTRSISTKLALGFNWLAESNIEQLHQMGIVPFITLDPRSIGRKLNSVNLVLEGKSDGELTSAARFTRKMGEKYGRGMFIRTLREMNLYKSHQWAGSPEKFKKTWKYVWNIFETEGANKYATWVFNPFVNSNRSSGNWKRYVLDEKYFDWFGLNAYNLVGTDSPYRMFNSDVKTAQKIFPNKPLMIAEIGSSRGYKKGEWHKDAFQYALKHNVRLINFWSDLWYTQRYHNKVDSRINSSEEALDGFREGIANPKLLGRLYNSPQC